MTDVGSVNPAFTQNADEKANVNVSFTTPDDSANGVNESTIDLSATSPDQDVLLVKNGELTDNVTDNGTTFDDGGNVTVDVDVALPENTSTDAYTLSLGSGVEDDGGNEIQSQGDLAASTSVEMSPAALEVEPDSATFANTDGDAAAEDEKATLNVTAVDKFGNAVNDSTDVNASVSLTTNDNSVSTENVSTKGADFGNRTAPYQFDVTNTEAEDVTLKAVDTDASDSQLNSGSAVQTFVGSIEGVDVTAPDTVVADGDTNATAELQLVDGNGNAVEKPDVDVSFSFDNGGAAGVEVVDSQSTTTNDSGVATVTFNASNSGETVTVTGLEQQTPNSYSDSAEITTTTGEINATNSKLYINEDEVQSATDDVTDVKVNTEHDVAVELQDPSGNVIEGQDVSYTLNGSEVATATSNSNGFANTTITLPTEKDTYVLNASAGEFNASTTPNAQVNITTVAENTTALAFADDAATSIAPNSQGNSVDIEAVDEYGNVNASATGTVTLETSDDTVVDFGGDASATDGLANDGIASFAVDANNTGTATLSATVPDSNISNVSQDITVADPAGLELSFDRNVATSDVTNTNTKTTATLEAQFVDENGDALGITDENITFARQSGNAAELDQSLDDYTETTDGDGNVTIQVNGTSTTGETSFIAVAENYSVQGTDTITTTGPADRIHVTAEDATIEQNTSTNVTAAFVDSNDRIVPRTESVQVSTDLGDFDDTEKKTAFDDAGDAVATYTFNAPADEGGEANINALGGGLSGSTTVAVAEDTAANLSVDYTVDSTNVSVNETVTATATVENTGDAAGSTDLTFYADGQEVETQSVDVDANNSTTVEFTTSFDAAGSHNVSVNDLEQTEITVTEDDGTPSVGDYTDNDGVVQTENLQTAIDDWRSGDIETDLLTDVIDAWRSGDSVAA